MTIVNGGWTSWEGWTSCSVSCGSGQRRRLRSCSDPSPANGGNTCGRVNAQYQSCNQQRCPGMHLLGQIKFQLTQSNYNNISPFAQKQPLHNIYVICLQQFCF